MQGGMQRRYLGKTGLQVTTVGLGGGWLAAFNVSEEQAMRTVWASLEGGANWIDTAPLYRSEAVIGRALRERPDLAAGCILSTKTGNYGDHQDYTYDGTLRSVERSLHLLGVEHLPIVHIHDVGSVEQLDEVMGPRAALQALQRLQEEGVVGHIGLGTMGVEVLTRAINSGAFDVLLAHNEYNLLTQKARGVIEHAADCGVGMILAGVYATGILAKGSQHPRARFLYADAGPEIRERVAALEALCGRWGCSLAAAAIQFCLRGPAASSVVVLGARSEEQALQNLAWGQEAIAPGFWSELDQLLASWPALRVGEADE